ncbi:hypothetical protein SAMN04488040_1747 [Sulfitobacter marinus]|uniref:Uncharacterized protein n=2 Tax=Sulfitobacter marinus TaxID=394264 RepID=A0A1I6S5M1_9RHOB|nr:hypothetical protein SAMN04488040_1747 [Sulfitobacter marinus]
MSAPDTNIDKQEHQHKPALLGIRGAMIFGVLMVMLLLFFVVDNGREDMATEASVIEQDAGAASVDATAEPVGTVTTDSN